MTILDPRESWDWDFWHAELAGQGRGVIHKLQLPWLFDEWEKISAEEFPTIGQDFDVHVQVGDFIDFGKGLVLGQAQICEADDANYTGALASVVAITSFSRESWYIGGGADGPIIREALRYKDTKSVVCADISTFVPRETQQLIPSFWEGAQYDTRLKLVQADAKALAEKMVRDGESVDIVILDLVDETDENYTERHQMTADHVYHNLSVFQALLKPNGVIVIQSHECSDKRWSGPLAIAQRLRKLFLNVHVYRTFVPFFGYFQSFTMATNRNDWTPFSYVNSAMTFEQAMVQIYHPEYLAAVLNYWNDARYRGMFALETFLEKILAV